MDGVKAGADSILNSGTGSIDYEALYRMPMAQLRAECRRCGARPARSRTGCVHRIYSERVIKPQITRGALLILHKKLKFFDA
jgi:hypothetical protein